MTLNLTTEQKENHRRLCQKKYRQTTRGKEVIAACNYKYYHSIKAKKKQATLLLPAIFAKLTPAEIKTIEIFT